MRSPSKFLFAKEDNLIKISPGCLQPVQRVRRDEQLPGEGIRGEDCGEPGRPPDGLIQATHQEHRQLRLGTQVSSLPPVTGFEINKILMK